MNNINKIFIHQEDENDCGPACLAMMAKLYKGNVDFASLKASCGTNIEGTSLLGLSKGAQSIGLKAEGFEASLKEIKENGKPCIMLINKGNYNHYILFVKESKGKFCVADPCHGFRKYSEKELNNIWRSKLCLYVTKTEQFQNFKLNSSICFFIKLLWKMCKIDIIMSCIISILLAATNVSVAVIFQLFINAFYNFSNTTRINLILFLIVSCLSIRSLLEYNLSLILARIELKYSKGIANKFFEGLFECSKTYFTNKSKGDITNRFHDIARIQKNIQSIIGNIGADMCIALFSIILLMIYNIAIGGITFIFLTIFAYTIVHYQKGLKTLQYMTFETSSICSSHLLNSIIGLDTIKSFCKEFLVINILKNKYFFSQKSVFTFNRGKAHFSLLINFIGIGLFILIFLTIKESILDKRLQIGNIIAIFMLVQYCAQSTINICLYSISFEEAKIAYHRLVEVVFASKKTNNSANKTNIKCINSISISNMNFNYALQKSIISNLNYTFSKGRLYLIKGRIGSGKTTLCEILTKFQKPTNGNIFINGKTNIKDISTDVWRQHIGYSKQECFLFHGTLFENIAFGDNFSKEYITEFCRNNNFLPLLDSFAAGLDTLIGDNGETLSGGQKQLICLIRLFLRNKDAYILDEPTSAMDKELYKIVMDFITKEKKDKIIIIVSHEANSEDKYFDYCLTI